MLKISYRLTTMCAETKIKVLCHLYICYFSSVYNIHNIVARLFIII